MTSITLDEEEDYDDYEDDDDDDDDINEDDEWIANRSLQYYHGWK